MLKKLKQYQFVYSALIPVCLILILGIIFFTFKKYPTYLHQMSDQKVSGPKIVSAEHYREFWLWTGVKGQPVLNQASVIYLHQGEFALRGERLDFDKQGLTVRKLADSANNAMIWLTFRVIDLEASDWMVKRIIEQINNWQIAGNKINGIQLDFDAGSRKLANYAEFLTQFRAALPPQFKLSITGLLDWAKTGDINVLNQLAGTLDEIVIQTYQHRSTVTDYEKYLPELLKLTVPFKIGLVQHGKWESQWQKKLADSKYYLGEVIFLVNPKSQ